jgi:hypothetical protein
LDEGGVNMPNSWGRPPRYDIWHDLQALAFWVLLIGVGGYILFPNFFGDVYARLIEPTSQVVDTNESYDPNLGSYDPNLQGSYSNGTYDSSTTVGSLFPSGYYGSDTITSSMYNLSNEVSTGHWILFVADGNFKQLAVTSESYTFLLRLIEKDKNGEAKNTVILASNGQIRKYIVTDEIYSIITNMASIDTRAKTG